MEQGPANINKVKECEIVLSVEDSFFIQYKKSRRSIDEDFSFLINIYCPILNSTSLSQQNKIQSFLLLLSRFPSLVVAYTLTSFCREHTVLFMHWVLSSRGRLPPRKPLSFRLLSVVIVHSFTIGPSYKTEIFRAFVGESSQIEEEWRELLSTAGCCLEVTLNRYL